MSKRDFFGAVLIYLLSASIIITSASLLLNNIWVFYIGELIAVPVSLMIVGTTSNSHTKDD